MIILYINFMQNVTEDKSQGLRAENQDFRTKKSRSEQCSVGVFHVYAKQVGVYR